tara:strand:+ start:509 stop:2029 length:1521 start_codon:yes stop_codon:yes gene_type:complete
MEIFGFEIKRKGNEEKAPSFVAPINDDGAQVVEVGQSGYSIGGGYAQGTYLDMEGGVKSEQDLILRYRQMSLIPEVDMAIDDIVQEAISSNDLDAQVGINLDATKFSDSIKSKIRDEFSEVLRLLRFNQTSSDIFRKWYVDGRMYFHLLVEPSNPKKGVVGLRMIDPLQIKKVREVLKKKNAKGVEVIDKVKEYYTYNQGGFERNQMTGSNTQTLQISPDAIVYTTSGMMDANRRNIIGYMHKGLKSANQLKMMEDALVIYRISRAPERRIFYIDVGNLPKAKAEQYLADTMTRYKNKLVYNADTGEIRDDRKHMSMLEDFWLPRREGGRGTEITTLPGGQNLGEIEDIIYFQRKLFRSLNVPISRLETEAGFSLGRTTEISRDEVKFSRFVDRLRMKFSSMFYDILKTQLVLKGIIPIEEWELEKENIRFDYQKDSHFVEMKEAEILRERVASLRELDEFVGKYYSQQWVRKNVLRQSEEEIEMIDGQIEDEGNEDGEGENSFDM